MEATRIVEQAKRILECARMECAHPEGYFALEGVLAEAREFLRHFAGEKSAFLAPLEGLPKTKHTPDHMRFAFDALSQSLGGFIRYVENGLLDDMSIERQARVDVVSDILSQAQSLLASGDTHPAASAMLVGACLEEFLRTWVEDKELKISDKEPSIDVYAKALREADLLSKQDMKDITSWAGLRNHAAHGHWDEVSDKKRIGLMLDGVNFFMRTHGARSESR